ncbi:hypothetical protein [Larkinella rosea]|uniref:Uncharacterized protein n=1 Tax=Larkinella rosea TaxID=2025312 RepID=A0A3P1BP58_9BACT|nr:hypothetical protein [Larkinella rosea]RRB02838.1 hypothetical protein EHT25_20585 [Larkinella rosea]
MKTFRIEIRTDLCLKNKEILKRISFKDPIIGDGYGTKRFITESEEVAYLDFFESGGLPFPLKEISSYFTLINTEKKKKNEYSFLSTNDAFRYFSDLSKSGKFWYMDQVGNPDFYKNCYDKETGFSIKNLNLTEKNIKSQPITFHYWLALSPEKKMSSMEYFFKNPVHANYPILNHPFWDL